MTPFHKRLSPTTKRMADDMTIRNLSPNTIDSYTYHVDKFLRHFSQPAEQLGPEEIRSWQLHLIQEKKIGWSSFNQAVCALRFLYRFTIPRAWHVKMIPFGKRPKKLPTVLGHDQVMRLIECTTNRKHRMLLLTLYSAGLRLSEGSHLQATDINSDRMTLQVMQGKGNKQRLVPISPRLLETLRQYWREARPTSYLFPGRDDQTPISGTTIQKALKVAAAKANLPRSITPHTLRHSYATNLLESGVDILAISQLLGHKSFTTTMIYLHVRKPHLGSTPSPIDWLPIRQCPGWQQSKNSWQQPKENNRDQKS